ncbi:MAG: hypothetical protein A3A80_03995 [Candidatus Terrybacteria bacterium RIFCSPLOWO2_01_FULL_44_24]|uniref:Uncharacterized protein n=1 Tax=Candidatus Terrybacteria bacterium RIFCSPHIGHO2_01_FULL_43_35 TaxID=1802361 RepID=A0A1G2PHX0_9BACT|nr:MAG: hypothetical protein A2828_02920 [Candidatus Terrybacteria bacterium RIFCSPHIGHO2_01_FULL_43_35]OHA50172.1 MAG: hypothetical protein A3B75_01580 [Candidatus Terrybacteria bacterium RIFCSPHIGHO2_02_FULL_43_14]OHA51231.1 MAG: hypothetical protein A3A80_03995 [Candidatus Terrybacteria bacterium RIFCSPLOWO2_01_FULL_44_24]
MDFRIIVSIFLLLGSFVGAALGAFPAWQSISESIIAKKDVERHVRDLGVYFNNLKKLEADIKNNIDVEKCTRLNNIAPAGVDLPQLLIQFDNLAAIYQARLGSININEPTSISEEAGSVKTSGLSLEIPITNFNQIFQFFDDLYYLERLTDIKAVDLNVPDLTKPEEKVSVLNNLRVAVFSSIRALDCDNLTK